ncbi:hypothetical protein GCM10028824_36610 [Hymenobacter segetis]|uniref:DNA-binding protein n=1 Tax=Hymenobacter segetis TaxID=2025509 RepID=A0ABU9LVJ5_9BACT
MQVPNFSRPPAQHIINFGIDPPTPLQLVLWEHIAPLIDYIQALEKRVNQIERGQSEWVSTKQALQITGIKSGDTLKRLRELPNAIIIVRFEGKTSKQPKYLRASLIAYCESRIRKPTQPGRNLAA